MLSAYDKETELVKVRYTNEIDELNKLITISNEKNK